MTKQKERERAEAIVELRTMIKPGDTVWTVLESVSRSGMSRVIRVVIPTVKPATLVGGGGVVLTRHTADTCPGRPCAEGCDHVEYAPVDPPRPAVEFLHPNHLIGLAIGAKRAKSGEGLIIGGCGMDMGFHLVYELSYQLYGREGYACLGPGDGDRGRRCPSNYHSNHRDRIACPGVGSGDDNRRCYAPSSYGRYKAPDGWPRREIPIGDGQTVSAGYLACLNDAAPYEVCSTCKGVGTIENPDGPERWDLVHTDGYALRQAWL